MHAHLVLLLLLAYSPLHNEVAPNESACQELGIGIAIASEGEGEATTPAVSCRLTSSAAAVGVQLEVDVARPSFARFTQSVRRQAESRSSFFFCWTCSFAAWISRTSLLAPSSASFPLPPRPPDLPF